MMQYRSPSEATQPQADTARVYAQTLAVAEALESLIGHGGPQHPDACVYAVTVGVGSAQIQCSDRLMEWVARTEPVTVRKVDGKRMYPWRGEGGWETVHGAVTLFGLYSDPADIPGADVPELGAKLAGSLVHL